MKHECEAAQMTGVYQDPHEADRRCHWVAPQWRDTAKAARTTDGVQEGVWVCDSCLEMFTEEVEDGWLTVRDR